MLFAAPPETQLEWDDSGIEGAYKFLNRVWRIQDNLKEKAGDAVIKAMHKTVKKVTDDMQSFKFNTAIASMMEFVNAIYQSGADKEAYKTLVLLLAPIAPHFCEEIWQILGNKESVAQAQWPKFDPKMLVEDIITMVVQVNGKVRSKLDVSLNMAEDALKQLCLADEKLKVWLAGKPVRKFIVVPNKIINIVV
jgi:leucyl-tRNA synthetase